MCIDQSDEKLILTHANSQEGMALRELQSAQKGLSREKKRIARLTAWVVGS